MMKEEEEEEGKTLQVGMGVEISEEQRELVPENQEEKFMEERYEEIQPDSNQVFEELFNLEHDFFKGFELVLD